MDGATPTWLRTARWALVALAVLGVVACLWVTANLWGDWPGHPRPAAVLVDLGVLSGATAVVLPLALLGPRVFGVPAALLLLLWGWTGTWAYGFLWVPGAAAVVACLLPRPRSTVPAANDVASAT